MHIFATSLIRGASSAGRAQLKIVENVLRAGVTFVADLHRRFIAALPPLRADTQRWPRHGRVTLVGAGPGDPELLTIKALRTISSANVILFDALVSDAILALAGSETELICVGKRGGRPSCRQDVINDLMVRHAQAGKHVVRLKAGDPAIFGRAGEEISYLESAGIEVSIVPGITAASAMAAAFGISLTHRNHAKSVRFVTGHSKNGGLPEDVDWRQIADPSATTVFYMGAPLAGEIVARLIAHGAPSNTPVGIAASLSRDSQQIARGELGQLETIIAAFDRSAPLIIGVGAVYANEPSTPRAAQETIAPSDFI